MDLDTPESRQSKRNQLAFEYICSKQDQSSIINEYDEKLITDGSVSIDYPYGKLWRSQLSIAARSEQFLSISGPTYKSGLIKSLMKYGAKPDWLDTSGRDAILWSIGSFQGQNPHPIGLFFGHASFDINQIYEIEDIGDELQKYEPKVTLLIAAVLNTWQIYDYPQARYDLVKLLLQHNANRKLAPNGKTALQIAIDLDDQEMIRILKEK